MEEHRNKLLIFGCLLITALVHLGKCDELENYVWWKMADYPKWLKSHHLDPSPIKIGSDRFSVTNRLLDLDCFLSYHAVMGHSGTMEDLTVTASLEDKYFEVGFTTNASVTFFGEYRANGTLISTMPIDGQGSWSITVPYISVAWFEIEFRKTARQSLSITKHSLDNIFLGSDEQEIHFENLWDNDVIVGYDQFIKESVLAGFKSYLNSGPNRAEHPIRTSYLKFWKEILSKTTIAEILRTTIPPDMPTTTTKAPTTTAATTRKHKTVARKTAGPANSEPEKCDCLINTHMEQTHSHNRKIVDQLIETRKAVDPDGVPVTIIKKTIITKERDI